MHQSVVLIFNPEIPIESFAIFTIKVLLKCLGGMATVGCCYSIGMFRVSFPKELKSYPAKNKNSR